MVICPSRILFISVKKLSKFLFDFSYRDCNESNFFMMLSKSKDIVDALTLPPWIVFNFEAYLACDDEISLRYFGIIFLFDFACKDCNFSFNLISINS